MMRLLTKMLVLALTGNALQSPAAPRIKRGGDFKDLVTDSTVFADKSLLIKDIIEDESTALLIAMPRRWGKTVNLNMIRRFLELPVDDHGEPLNKKSTDNYKLFAGGEVDAGIRGQVELSPLRIANTKLFDRTEALSIQGTRPVIYIDFKNCKAANYESVRERIRSTLSRSFRQHAYLKNSAKLTQRQRELVNQYIEESNDPSIEEGLIRLSDALHQHHGKKVWILIDEYDAVANVAYREFSEGECKQTIDMFKGIYEAALKNNDGLEKGVLTGVQYIAQSGMLSGLNDPGKYDFTNAKYAQHYGLDQSEVDHFFARFQVPPELEDRAKQWYNGYKVPSHLSHGSTSQQREIIGKYNVWSIVNYLAEGRDSGDFSQFKSHWEKSGSIDFLNSLFDNKEIKDKTERLVNGEPISLKRISDFSVNNFKTLKEMLGGNKRVTPEGVRVLFSYLFIGGYLTIDGSKPDLYRLPNMEITYEMGNRLITYYETICTIDPDKLQGVTDMLQQVMDEDTTNPNSLSALLKDFYDKFRSVIQSIYLVNDENEEGVFMNEDIVHSILSNISLQTQHRTMGSEMYTKKILSKERGRADLKMTKGDRGIIMEVKCVPTKKDSNQHMQEALKQAKSYRGLLDTRDNLFMAINVAKKTSKPEERSIELLCATALLGQEYTIEINAEGELFDSNKKRRAA